MNLHVLPDSKFSNNFYANLKEAGILSVNKVVVRSSNQKLSYVSHPVPFAPLYSSSFNNIIGPISSYDQVFIHQFNPLMYRWVARNSFQKLAWMIWGADLYNLPFVKNIFHEPMTRQIVKKSI